MQLPRDPSNVTDVLVTAFPNRLAGDVQSVLAVVPDERLAPMGPFEVEVQGETVAIPSRIYNEEPSADSERLITGTRQVILHCLYSRHSDGRIRHRHLEQILGSTEPWVVPFVVQLAGEYVVEMLADLAVPGSAQRRLYGEFITRNPVFFARTERHAYFARPPNRADGRQHQYCAQAPSASTPRPSSSSAAWSSGRGGGGGSVSGSQARIEGPRPCGKDLRPTQPTTSAPPAC